MLLSQAKTTLRRAQSIDVGIIHFAANVPRITGTISFISSSLILLLIFRSRIKLSTIYHRIMFGMSLADLFASAAMALTTLPMPKPDDPYWDTTGEEWIGQPKLGNVQTCAAQGFFFSTGINVMYGYNGALCAYYASAIAFQMNESAIKKKVEPFLHAIPLLFGFSFVIPAFYFKLYNAITNEAWCTFFVINPSAWVDVITLTLIASMMALFIVIVLSFILIIWRVQQNAKQFNLKNRSENGEGHEIEAIRVIKDAHRNTKLIIVQSLTYTGAFLLTLLFPLVNTVNYSIVGNQTRSLLISKFLLVFLPLQGFFNFLIFFWHKGKIVDDIDCCYC